MTERQLVTLRAVTALSPIPGADSIEAAQVDGWTVVVKRGQFDVGDPVVYFEIDSALPLDDSRFTFLAPRGVKQVNGAAYHVLKTAKLRGVYSQGLVLPRSDFPELRMLRSGEVADVLGIFKYEPPVPAELAGEAVGPFPTDVARKTDEERLQNLPGLLEHLHAEHFALHGWVATEKIDGTSTTFIAQRSRTAPEAYTVRVAGRNWELAQTENNTLWRMLTPHIRRLLVQLLLEARDSVALQGETFGEGIQGNPLGMRGQHWRLFSVFVDGEELPRMDWTRDMHELAVPTHALKLPATPEEAVAQTDRASLINPERKIEGLVWRHVIDTRLRDGSRASFKVISPRYLMKHDR